MDNEKSSRKPVDALEALGFAVYGRSPLPREFIGGSDARVLSDAATRIAELEAEVERLRERSSQFEVVARAAHDCTNNARSNHRWYHLIRTVARCPALYPTPESEACDEDNNDGC